MRLVTKQWTVSQMFPLGHFMVRIQEKNNDVVFGYMAQQLRSRVVCIKSSVPKITCFSSRRPEFCSQHSRLATHNLSQPQHQEICCFFLVSMASYMHNILSVPQACAFSVIFKSKSTCHLHHMSNNDLFIVQLLKAQRENKAEKSEFSVLEMGTAHSPTPRKPSIQRSSFSRIQNCSEFDISNSLVYKDHQMRLFSLCYCVKHIQYQMSSYSFKYQIESIYMKKTLINTLSKSWL